MQNDGLLRQPIACYEIAKRTYDFGMTYDGNRTINMALVMLFLVGNNNNYDNIYLFYSSLSIYKGCNVAQWLERQV